MQPPAHDLQDAEEAGPLGGARGWDEEDERHLWKAKLQLVGVIRRDSTL